MKRLGAARLASCRVGACSPDPIFRTPVALQLRNGKLPDAGAPRPDAGLPLHHHRHSHQRQKRKGGSACDTALVRVTIITVVLVVFIVVYRLVAMSAGVW